MRGNRRTTRRAEGGQAVRIPRLMTSVPAPLFENKICTPGNLAERVAALPHPLVFTNGCFDILHRGHSPIWRRRVHWAPA